MKKLLILLLVALSVATFCIGCGKKSKSDEKEKETIRAEIPTMTEIAIQKAEDYLTKKNNAEDSFAMIDEYVKKMESFDMNKTEKKIHDTILDMECIINMDADYYDSKYVGYIKEDIKLLKEDIK